MCRALGVAGRWGGEKRREGEEQMPCLLASSHIFLAWSDLGVDRPPRSAGPSYGSRSDGALPLSGDAGLGKSRRISENATCHAAIPISGLVDAPLRSVLW